MAVKTILLTVLLTFSGFLFPQSEESWEDVKAKGGLEDFFYFVKANLDNSNPKIDSAMLIVRQMLAEKGSVSAADVFAHFGREIAPFTPVELISFCKKMNSRNKLATIEQKTMIRGGAVAKYVGNSPNHISSWIIKQKRSSPKPAVLYYHHGNFWESEFKFLDPDGKYYTYVKFGLVWYLLSPEKPQKNQSTIKNKAKPLTRIWSKSDLENIHTQQLKREHFLSKKQYTSVDSVRIELKENQLLINEFILPPTLTMAGLMMVLGNPSRIKIKTEAEVAFSIRMHGDLGANWYVYDDLGLSVYENIENGLVNSIGLYLIRGTSSIYPTTSFHGEIILGGKQIDTTYSFKKLEEIPKHDLSEIEKGKRGGKSNYLGTKLHLRFSDVAQSGLISLNIYPNDSLYQAQGTWKEADITQIIDDVKNLIQKEETGKHSFKKETFQAAYQENVMKLITAETYKNPTPKVKQMLTRIKQNFIKLSQEK